MCPVAMKINYQCFIYLLAVSEAIEHKIINYVNSVHILWKLLFTFYIVKLLFVIKSLLVYMLM